MNLYNILIIPTFVKNTNTEPYGGVNLIFTYSLLCIIDKVHVDDFVGNFRVNGYLLVLVVIITQSHA